MKSKALIWYLISLASFSFVPITEGKKCECLPVKSEETTRWAGNIWFAYQEKGTFTFIAGKVEDSSGEIIEDALVEVFDQPDYLLCDYLPNNPNNCTTKPPDNQRRKVACRTGKDGAFCFNKLKAGRYELRISKGADWNVVHTVVVVKPKDKNSKDGGIEIIMSVGG